MNALVLALAITSTFAPGAYPQPQTVPTGAEGARQLGAGFAQREKLAIKGVSANADHVPRRGKLELTVDLAARYDNPFDPRQLDLRCEVVAPSGRKLTVPGFFMAEYARAESGECKPTGKSTWKIRLSPGEVGRYQYAVVATDRSGTVRSAARTFECLASASDGFAVVSKANPRYFECESGKPYLPIGFNVFVHSPLGSPPPANRLDRCLKLMGRLADNGGNFVRFRMDSWWNAIEGPPDAVAGYFGPGWYQQQTSWEIDRIYELAEQRGIRIMHCVDNANANVNDPREAWRRPYNYFLKEFGGPCDSVDDFWTNPEAIRLFRNRLRYTVARWGYSVGAFCWEFWNEYACRKNNLDAAANWHAEMARYLRGIDPYAHPITTSLMGDASLYDRIFSLPEMEINQVHTYVRSDLAEAQEKLVSEMTGTYNKPFFIGECGLAPGHGEGRYEWDADGLHIHNGLWAPTFAGAAGAGAFWYVEPSLDARDLYHLHRPLADFAGTIPWNSADLKPAQVSVPVFETLPAELHFTDFVVPVATKFAFEKPPVTTFDLHQDGRIENAEMIRPYLHCAEGRKAPPTFRVHFDKPGEFVVHVTESVGNDRNKLLVYVDGNQAVEKDFPAGKGLGKGSTYIEQYDNWKTTYDERVVVPVPAGDHEIRPEAVGKDRLEVGYSLSNYLCFEKSGPVRLTGVATHDAAFLWLQNRLSNWTTLWEKRELLPVPAGMVATVRGLADGAYRLEWWDTWKGGVTATQEGQCLAGQLRLELPRVERDVACRVLRQSLLR
jgi:hypothetical protein